MVKSQSHERSSLGTAEEISEREMTQRDQTRTRSLWREYFESAVVTMIMALFFMTFVAQAATVPTASMQNTILVGDHFLINKFIFGAGPHLPFLPQRDVKRGDVIVFKYPAPTPHRASQSSRQEVEQFKTFFIKRVIGLPGETIEVRGANVFINGQLLPEHRITSVDRSERVPNAALEITSDPPRKSDEPYSVYYEPGTINPPRGIVEDVHPSFQNAVGGKPFVIPANSYFVMGDNRDDSADSRVWGVVPRDLVVGRAMFVIWSYDESAPSSGFFLLDLLKNTRWRRTGTIIR